MSHTPPSPRALAMHEAACKRGELGYIDPDSGLFVMTSVYLTQQGDCCGSGCRHCPWDEEARLVAGRPDVPAYPWPAPPPVPPHPQPLPFKKREG